MEKKAKKEIKEESKEGREQALATAARAAKPLLSKGNWVLN